MILRWLLEQWYAINRRTDLHTLWPICKSTAPNIEQARMAFYIHMELDPIYSHMSMDEKLAYVKGLQ